MRILIVHNKYRQAGGEDAVVELERQLLATQHEVETFIFDNEGGAGQMVRALFSTSAAQKLAGKLAAFLPDVVHVHNVWYSAGPDLLTLIKSSGYPLVQTLHNYRSVCLNGMLTLNGSTCTACLATDYPLEGVLNRCNRDSLVSSAIVGTSVAWHRRQQTFTVPDRIICLTTFQLRMMERSTLPFKPGQLVVKPNYYPDRYDGRWTAPDQLGEYVLFAGRLTIEKGVDQLVQLAQRGVKIKVAGHGPEFDRLQSLKLPNLELLGWQTAEQVSELMRSALALLIPSTWHEGLPVVLVQALAEGCPLIVSDNENLAALVPDGVAGFTCPAQDMDGWYAACERIGNPAINLQIRWSARALYERLYSPAVGLAALEDIYQQAIMNHADTHQVI